MKRTLIVLFLLAAPRLHAQQPTPAPDTAADTTHTHKPKPTLATVVVTGTRLSAVDERTPSQVEQLDLTRTIPGPASAIHAMMNLPGVSLFDDQGARLQPELEVRGFTLSPVVGTPQGVGVFLNGVRMNEPDAQEVNFDLLPMAAVDQSSLIRGSNVLFGRNSLGGTLLLTTRRGGDTPEATLELGAGSFGQQTATVTAGGKVAGIDGFIAATGENEEGWRQATSSNTRNIFATVGYQWGPSHTDGDIALDFLYGHDKIYEAGSLPADLAQTNPRDNYTPGDFFYPEAYGLTLRGNGSVAGGILRGTLWGRRNNYEQFNANVPPPNTDEYIYNLSGGATAEWTRPFTIGRIPVGFTVGLDYERDNVHFRLLNVDEGPTSLATLADVRQENAAFYTQAIVTVLPQMDITGGLRGDYIRIPFRDDSIPANDGTSTYNRLSPEIGVTYRFTDDIKVFAAYKSGFRAPAPLELACASPTAPCSLPSALGADPTLKPVTTHDYEGGLDVDFTSRTNIDIDAFWTDVYNDIQFASPNLTQVYFINAPKTRRAGVEASGQLGLPEGVRLFASYSYVAATYQSTISFDSGDVARAGDLLPTSPLHRGRIGVGVTRAVGPVLVDGDIDIRGYSSQFLRGDEANEGQQIPGYTVAGLRGKVEYKRYAVEFQIDNLFDRRYYTFGIVTDGGPFYTPSFPRRFTLALSVKL
jgi:iron complex outermembrane recepter protein